ncbi:hypothetical protein [Anaerosacchariphilus polymeriproducens]|uniref:Condensin complex subunit 1 C-terminal domain-containing protein n=1 Tax=Anaerosacchariphilus polymeriproducens TaxID=1812858 RepID=A0A371AZF5_9FIRM|nr:hypothetical protein [Anaerosacchariphilus polymeriproducens]RDU24933.1 hypothetical protein DWV06_01515 [Anaerosacchariphilus polymeriproducens]
MDALLHQLCEDVSSKNNTVRKAALDKLLEMTEEQVEWVYDIWDIMVEKLSSENSYQRSIAVFVLAGLAKSDTQLRFASILEQYLSKANDDKFITSRQTLQQLWLIAISQESLCSKIVDFLYENFINNRHLTTHGNLIRKDIIYSLSEIYKKRPDQVNLDKFEILIHLKCDEKESKELLKFLK